MKFVVENLQGMSALLAGFAEYLRSQDISDEDVFFSRLAASELISNVIRHSGDKAVFTGELFCDRITISVYSESGGQFNLSPPRPSVFAENGRGLYIINQISINGVERGERGELTVDIKRSK